MLRCKSMYSTELPTAKRGERSGVGAGDQSSPFSRLMLSVNRRMVHISLMSRLMRVRAMRRTSELAVKHHLELLHPLFALFDLLFQLFYAIGELLFRFFAPFESLRWGHVDEGRVDFVPAFPTLSSALVVLGGRADSGEKERT